MPRRTPRAKTSVHEHLALQLTGWNARVAAGLNPDVWETRQHHDGMPVYEFGSSVELSAVCVGPPDRVHEAYRLSVHGSERHAGEFAQKLGAFQARDEQDQPRERRVRGQLVPVYEPPKGIGFIQRIPRSRDWTGFAWVPPRVLTDMLALLPNAAPLYVGLHEVRIARNRWVAGLTLQTVDPDIA